MTTYVRNSSVTATRTHRLWFLRMVLVRVWIRRSCNSSLTRSVRKVWQPFGLSFRICKRRGLEGKRKPPDRAPKLLEAWRTLLQTCRELGSKTTSCGLAGKSMGGRMATLIADEANVSGVVCLGYPFHPPGKPENLRTEHLRDLRRPTLICQGERDTFGTRADVATYDLSASISVVWLTDGDHSFKPRKSAGVTQEENILTAANTVAAFMLSGSDKN